MSQPTNSGTETSDDSDFAQVASAVSFPTLTYAELAEFALALADHLDYCGWGDAWERECADDLRARTRQVCTYLKAAGYGDSETSK